MPKTRMDDKALARIQEEAGQFITEKLPDFAEAMHRAESETKHRGKPEDGFVEIDVTHSRRTKAAGIGRFLRHTPTGRFLREHEIPRPQVVGGTDWE